MEELVKAIRSCSRSHSLACYLIQEFSCENLEIDLLEQVRSDRKGSADLSVGFSAPLKMKCGPASCAASVVM
jgi:hypothetical protein